MLDSVIHRIKYWHRSENLWKVRFSAIFLFSIPCFAAVFVVFPTHVVANTLTSNTTLPSLGPAPQFTLTTQDNTKFSLAQLQGKVVVVSFMFTRCTDTCPLLTGKLLQIRDRLGDRFASNVQFLTITLDSTFDSPEVLHHHAHAMGATHGGWTFLTGNPTEITDAVRSYGVFHQEKADSIIEHNLLTSIIDRHGMLRVQYMGDQFNENDFLADLESLLEPDPKKPRLINSSM